MLLLPFFHGEGFDDGLFIGVRGLSVLLVHHKCSVPSFCWRIGANSIVVTSKNTALVDC